MKFVVPLLVIFLFLGCDVKKLPPEVKETEDTVMLRRWQAYVDKVKKNMRNYSTEYHEINNPEIRNVTVITDDLKHATESLKRPFVGTIKVKDEWLSSAGTVPLTLYEYNVSYEWIDNDWKRFEGTCVLMSTTISEALKREKLGIAIPLPSGRADLMDKMSK